jgi:DNA (cytosine-5)-methyltransferase 1
MTKVLKYELALFAGIGGGILGTHLAGLTCIGSVEKNTYSNGVLLRRQNEGYLPPFPVWNDIKTFRSDNPECSAFIEYLRGISSELLISAGFPCQDISRAGKGEGLKGDNSGLWYEVERLLCEIRPRALFLENSTTLKRRGLDRILWQLAQAGYDAQWDVFGAHDTGAPQIRHRLWILSHTDSVYDRGNRNHRSISKKKITQQKAESEKLQNWRRLSYIFKNEKTTINWPAEPKVDGMVDGFPYRLVQRERLGDAQVPAVAAMALRELIKYTDLTIQPYCGSAGKQPQSDGERAYTACVPMGGLSG